MSTSVHRTRLISALAAIGLLTAACSPAGEEQAAPGDAGTSPEDAAFPMTVTNCGTELALDSRAEQIISLTQPQTDLVLELGARDRLIGYAQSAEPGELPGSALHDTTGLEVTDLGSGVPAREVTVSQGADLVLGASTWEFDSSGGAASMEDLLDVDMVPYLAAGGCPDQRLQRSVLDVVEDIEAVGAMLGEPERAAELADAYTDRVTAVIETTGEAEPIPVVELFVFGDAVETYAASTEQDIVRAAGGQNLFGADHPAFDGSLFATLSNEVIAEAEPEAFILSVGSEQQARDAAELLRERFPTTPAVQNDLIIAYSSNASLPGSLSIAEALEHVALQLHPDLF